jgi:AraC-like DNA-binding protein
MVQVKRDKPRGVLNVRAADVAHGLKRYWPSEALAPFVEHYWIVRWNVDVPQRAETLPHPSVHMVLERTSSEVAGVTRGRFFRMLSGEGRVLGTKFRPGAFRAFVTRPVASFTDRRWTLAEVFGDRLNDFDARALAEPDDALAAEIIDAFLCSLHPVANDAMTLARRVTERIASDREIIRVEQLVDEFGMTVRQLQRVFREYVGVTPKWVIQRYRLIEAAERLAAGPLPDLAALAAELGYADQPHFIRDFKKLVGRAPAEYARQVK